MSRKYRREVIDELARTVRDELIDQIVGDCPHQLFSTEIASVFGAKGRSINRR